MTFTKENEAAIEIKVEITPQGILIPPEAVQEWIGQYVEIIKTNQQIIIRPKKPTEREGK